MNKLLYIGIWLWYITAVINSVGIGLQIAAFCHQIIEHKSIITVAVGVSFHMIVLIISSINIYVNIKRMYIQS